MRKLLLISLILASSVFAQYAPRNDFLEWNWIRIEGDIDIDENNSLPTSLEIHHRLKDNLSQFHQFIIRPMIGQRINDETTVWFGWAYIEANIGDNIVGEHRLFQMITYTNRINDSIVFLSATRLEQRAMINEEAINHRVRQLLRVSVPFWKKNHQSISAFIQNEYFLRLNETQWAGDYGFDQNRLWIGLDYQTHIKDYPVIISAGVMRNTFDYNRTYNGFQVGVRIPLNQRKKKRP